LTGKLCNGARVILKPTENKNDEVSLVAMAKGGLSCVSPKGRFSAGLADKMMMGSGLGPCSFRDLARTIAARQISFLFSFDIYTREFIGTAATGSLKTFFEMIHLCFVGYRIDDDAAEAILDRYRTFLATRGENPRTVFDDEVIITVTGAYPYFKLWKGSDLSKVDTGAALALLQRALNPADIRRVLTKLLESGPVKVVLLLGK